MLLIPRILVVVVVILTVTNVEMIAPKPIDDAHRLRVLSIIFAMMEFEHVLIRSYLRPELQELIRSLRKDLQQSTPPTYVNQKLSIIFASMEYEPIDILTKIKLSSNLIPVHRMSLFSRLGLETQNILNTKNVYRDNTPYIGIKFQPSDAYNDTLVNYSEMLENSDNNTEFMSNLRQWIRLLVQAERRFIETIPVNQKNSSKSDTTHEEAHGQLLLTVPVVPIKTTDGGPQILEVITRTTMIDGNIPMVDLQQNSSEPHTTLEETDVQVLPTVPVVSNKTTIGQSQSLKITTRTTMIDGNLPLVDSQQNSSEQLHMAEEINAQTTNGPPQILDVTSRSSTIDGNIQTLVGLQQNSSEPNITLKESRGQVLPTVSVVSSKQTPEENGHMEYKPQEMELQTTKIGATDNSD